MEEEEQEKGRAQKQQQQEEEQEARPCKQARDNGFDFFVSVGHAACVQCCFCMCMYVRVRCVCACIINAQRVSASLPLCVDLHLFRA